MAEVVISPIAGYVLKKLSLLVEEGISSFFGLEGELEKLKDTISKIEAVLLDADEKYELSHQEKEFVGKLKDVLYDADDLLDLLSLQLPHAHEQNVLPRKACFIFSKPKLVNEVKIIRGRIDSIVKDQGIQIEPGQRRKQEGLTNRETISAEHEQVIGRDVDAAAIKNFLLASDTEQDNVSVIAIVGIGGLGKTTLARHAFNDSEVKEYFEKRIWVCVSEEFDFEIIFGNIILSAGSYKPEGGMEPLQQHLQRLICEKKYLLVLDDVWSDNIESWKKLKAPLLGGGKGSKIVVTTRDKMVGNATGATRSYDLKGLSEGDSWELFTKIAFDRREEEPNHPELVKIGKQVVERCVGVPLAIKSMGALLSNKPYVEWQRFEKLELSSIIQGEKNEIMPILKLSYDYLPPYLKQCFAYCSLFPKDDPIERLDLIRFWIAHGFIQSSTTYLNQHLEDVGNHYFMHLLHMSFFQELEEDYWSNTKIVKMHDLMHDLATEVAKSECFLVNDRTKSKIGKVRHLSLENGTPMSLKDFSSTLCKENRVRTLLQFQLNSYSSFKHLRVLDLADMKLEMVPKSICKLKSLRYLDLSHNYLSSLPDFISRLQKLETLNLANNEKLRELPRDLKNLVNLRHLILDDCDSLIQMPRGIGKLSFLQTLSKFVVCSKASSKCSAEISELAVLNNLRGSLEIKNSRNVRSYFKSDFLKNKKGLEILTINFEKCSEEGITDDETLLEGALQLPSLKQFVIRNYNAKKPQNAQRLSFELPRLIGLGINIGDCKYLPDLGHLPNLKSIRLSYLTNLTYFSPINHLSCLESIEIKELSALEEIPPLDKLHRLKRISFERLSALTNFPSLPQNSCLESLHLLGLTTLPHLPPLIGLSSLKDISLSGLESVEYIQEGEEKKHCSTFCYPKTFYSNSTSMAVVANCSHLFLPSLKYLKLVNMPKLKGWWKQVNYSSSYSSITCLHFPILSNLNILKCPNLKNMPFFPSVERLGLENCNMKLIMQQHEEYMMNWVRDINNKNESSSSLTSASPLPLSKLKYLDTDPESVKDVPKRLFQYFTSLEEIRIGIKDDSETLPDSIRILKGGTLQHLVIGGNLKFLPDWIEEITSLQELTLEVSNQTVLPQGLDRLTSLRGLNLHRCFKLTVLLDTMTALTSLQRLNIRFCRELESLPDWMPQLTSLKELLIYGCPKLEERCIVNRGVDWPKISHIPLIFFEGTWIQDNRGS